MIFFFVRRESSQQIFDRYSCPFKFLKSLFTIHGVLRPSRTTIHFNPIHFICFSNPLHKMGVINRQSVSISFYNKTHDLSIETVSQDSQKLYEPFPNLFGSFRDKYKFLLFVTTFGTNIRPYGTNVDHFWNQMSEHVYAISLYGYKAIWLYSGWI